MRIPITFAPPSQVDCPFPPQIMRLGSDEVVLIELQGTLEIEGDKQGELIGTLHVDDTDKTKLQIGRHMLEGKIASLAKPLAVIHVVRPKDEQVTEGTLPTCAETAFEILSVVKRKIIFSKRPQHIIHSDATTK